MVLAFRPGVHGSSPVQILISAVHVFMCFFVTDFSRVKTRVLAHSPKSQISNDRVIPIPPSVSKLPALAKNPEHFIYSLPLIFRIPRLSYKCANASPFSVFGQPPFFVMCEGSHILKKGNPQHLRKREIPEFTKKGNPPNSEISRMFYLTQPDTLAIALRFFQFL